jgi:uncharacterized sulfatase
LENPNAEWSGPAYSQIQRGTDQSPPGPKLMGRSVRTERWRYTEWDDGKQGRELYDHENDPQEYTNLAEVPELAGRVREMKELLRRGRN